MSETTVIKNKSGAGRYTYADLTAVTEYLAEIGWRYYQYIDRLDGDDYIMTVPVNAEGKELPPRRGVRIVEATLVGIKNPAQEQGSAITYARRYSLLMAFGLSTDDDDAQSLTIPKDQKASEHQLKILRQVYTGDNLTKLLEANEIQDIREISMAKASELIKKLQEKNK